MKRVPQDAIRALEGDHHGAGAAERDRGECAADEQDGCDEEIRGDAQPAEQRAPHRELYDERGTVEHRVVAGDEERHPLLRHRSYQRPLESEVEHDERGRRERDEQRDPSRERISAERERRLARLVDEFLAPGRAWRAPLRREDERRAGESDGSGQEQRLERGDANRTGGEKGPGCGAEATGAGDGSE